jgi:hypothetical protein
VVVVVLVVAGDELKPLTRKPPVPPRTKAENRAATMNVRKTALDS